MCSRWWAVRNSRTCCSACFNWVSSSASTSRELSWYSSNSWRPSSPLQRCQKKNGENGETAHINQFTQAKTTFHDFAQGNLFHSSAVHLEKVGAATWPIIRTSTIRLPSLSGWLSHGGPSNHEKGHTLSHQSSHFHCVATSLTEVGISVVIAV